MKFIEVLKNKKLFLLNTFLTVYVGINMIGGERGLVSYFEKKKIEKTMINNLDILSSELNSIENKNNLLSSNLDLDYIDILYREKFKFGKKNEIVIKLR